MEFPGLLEKTVVPERNTILQTAALQHRITAAPKVALKRYFAVKRTLEWSKKYFEKRRAPFSEISFGLLDRDNSEVYVFTGRNAVIHRIQQGPLGKRRNRGMRVPSKGECLDLMKRYNGREHIIQHCMKVAEVALSISTALNRKGENLNLDEVEAAALLHDITKAESLDSGEDHSVTAHRLLSKLGYTRIAEIVRQHVFLLKDSDSPRVSEEEVVNYSDKRVCHDQVVTLRERFDDLRARYCRDEEGKKWMDRMESFSNRIEKKIFSKLDIEPEDLICLWN